MQRGSLNLEEAALVEVSPDARGDLRATPEGVSRRWVADKIHLPVPVSLLHVLQTVPLVRQRLQALREHLPTGCVDAELALLGALYGSPRAYDVACVHEVFQLLELVSQPLLVEVQLDRADLRRPGRSEERLGEKMASRV
eukprot:scaffold7340_cov266-Pinguiococcus_pyrenoidosus.AAC.54